MNNALRYRAVELGADDDEGFGHATFYDVPYKIAPNKTETIAPGAFDDALRARDGIVPIFWSHGWAKTNAHPDGHATLESDGSGVRVRDVVFYDTDGGKALAAATDAKALREWSLGFKAGKIRVRAHDERIERGEIVELSVALRGMAPTTMTFRSDDDIARLREAGLIDAEAELIVEEDAPVSGDRLRAKYNDAETAAHIEDGTALPDGSYDIQDLDDLADALDQLARASYYDRTSRVAEAHVVRRARALGAEDRLPKRLRGLDAEANEDAPAVEEQAYGLLRHRGVREALRTEPNTNEEH